MKALKLIRFGQRYFSSTVIKRKKIEEFVMIGGGLMGSGIAQVGALTGHKVTLVDLSEDVLNKSRVRIEDSLKRVAKKKFQNDSSAGETFIKESMARLTTTTTPDNAIKTADLIVEGVTENLELKQILFASFVVTRRHYPFKK